MAHWTGKLDESTMSVAAFQDLDLRTDGVAVQVPYPGRNVDAFDLIQSAITKVEAAHGGRVRLDAGKTYTLNKVGARALRLSPDNSGTRKPVVIDLNGSTIKLSANTYEFLSFASTLDYDTFHDIEICNGKVDRDNIAQAGAIVIQPVRFNDLANSHRRLNFNRISIHDIETLNVPALINHFNVTINSVHGAAGETATYTNRIRVERCNFNGGSVGVQINGGGPAVDGINAYLDDVLVSDCSHYVTPWDSALPTSFAMAGVHLGSRGKGGRGRIRNCHGYGHRDVFVETNAWDDMVIENCHSRNSTSIAFLQRNWSTPPNPNQQKTTYRNVSTSANDTGTGGHYAIAVSAGGAPVVGTGDILVDGASFYRNISGTAQTQDLLRPFIDVDNTELRSITIRNVDTHFTFGEWTGNTTPVAAAVKVRPTVSAADVRIQNLNSRVAFTHNATNANVHHVFLNGILGMVEVENVNAATAITAAGADTSGIVYIGNTTTSAATSIVGLKMDRIKWRSTPGGTAATAIRVKGAGLTLPAQVILRDCNFSPMVSPTGALTFDTAGVNNTGWILRGNLFRAGDTSRSGLPANVTRVLAPTPPVGYQAVALTPNRAYICAVKPTEQITVQNIGFFVTTASGTDDPCDVAIYTHAAAPVRLAASAVTNGKLNAGTGKKLVPLTTPYTLAADTTYYVALATNSAATIAMTLNSGAFTELTTAGTLLQAYQAAAHPLPDPFVPAGAAGNGPFLVLES